LRAAKPGEPETHSKADSILASSSSLWIRTLATPYLRGYRAVSETRGGLRGYRFWRLGQIWRERGADFSSDISLKALTISIFNPSRRNALFSPLSNR